jgi:hypothetical protein
MRAFPQTEGLPTVSVSVTIGPFSGADAAALEDALLEHADEWNLIAQRPQALWPTLPELRETLHAVAIQVPWGELDVEAGKHLIAAVRAWMEGRRSIPEVEPRYVTIYGPRHEVLSRVRVDRPDELGELSA